MSRKPRYLRIRDRLQTAFAFVFLLNSLFPAPFVAAQVQVIARPGAGVSRLPLRVTAFDAPGFGDLASAVNLATGNAFLSVDGVSANSLQSSADNPDIFATQGWTVSSRLALSGFGQDLSTAPASFSLLHGDGSVATFVRAVPVKDALGTTLSCPAATGITFDMGTKPSWIQRYSDNACGVAFYRLEAQAGLSYSEEWVVLLVGGVGGSSIAHYYAHDGTRYTFFGDGQYVDFSQTLHQQYVSASTPYSSAEGLAGPKTEFTYDAVGSGRLRMVEDAYGRVTTYEWTSQGYQQPVLTRINYLLSDEADNNTAKRHVALGYQVDNGDAYVTSVTFSTDSGESKAITFEYAYDTGLLQYSHRQVAGGTLTLHYEYDLDRRVTQVTESAGQQQRVSTHYDYSGTSADFGGALVTVTQTPVMGQAKVSEYHFDAMGRLRRKVLQDARPDDPTATRNLTWEYTYYDDGNLGLLVEPAVEPAAQVSSGRVTHFAYDDRGNLTREAVYKEIGFFTQELRQPAQVAFTGLSPNRAIGFEEEFSLTAEVSNDELERGVSWFFLDSSGQEIEVPATFDPLPSGTSGPNGPLLLPPPFVLVGTTTVDTGDPSQPYEVTATFRAGTVAYNGATIRARSNRDVDSYADQPVNLVSPIVGMTINGGSGLGLVVAPGCLRRPSEINQPLSACGSTYAIPAAVQLIDGYTGDANKYSDVTFQVIGRSYTSGGMPTISSSGALSVPWYKFGEPNPSTPRTVTVIARSVAVPSQTSPELPIALGFFGLKKVATGLGAWGVNGRTDELADGSHYQFAVEVYNKPVSSVSVNWSTSAITGNIGTFSQSYGSAPANSGCLATAGVPMGGYEGTVYAKVAGFPSVSLSAWTKVVWVIWGEYGEGCDGVDIAPPGMLPQSVSAQGLGATGTNSWSADGSGASSAVDGVATELTSDLRPNYEYYRTYSYDQDNRLVEQVDPAPAAQTVGGGGVTADYDDVVEAYRYDGAPAVSIVDGTGHTQTFVATQSVVHKTSVGVADGQLDVLRSMTDTYGADGLLLDSTLEWADSGSGGLSHWRRTDYLYPSQSSWETVATEGGGSQAILQYRDMVREATTTSSDGGTLPQSVGAVTQSFVYDRLGNVVKEVQDGVVEDVSVSGAIFAQRVVERQFNGFGQQLWERVSLGGAVSSESGWSYAGTGELAYSWERTKAGESKYRVSTYGYGTGSEAGWVVSEKMGPGSRDGTLAQTRSEFTYAYDDFGRKISQVQVIDTSTSYETTYAYDTLNRVTSRAGPGEATTKTYYDPTGEKSQEVVGTSNGALVTHTWERDNMGYVTSETVTPSDGVSAPYTVLYERDVFGRLLAATHDTQDGIGETSADRRTLYGYDSEGNLLFEVGPALKTVSDPAGRWFTDGRRPAVLYGYDGLGQKVREERVLDGVVSFGPSGPSVASGGVTAVATTTYDGLGNAVLVQDAGGYATESAFDAAGQAFRTRRDVEGDGSLHADTWTAYDASGRVTKAIDPEGYATRHEYDLLGNVLADVNEAGYRIKEHEYTDDGLLRATYEPSISPGAGTVQAPGSVGRVLTQWNDYDSAKQQPYPSSIYTASMNNAPTGAAGAAGGGIRTDYVYDWAGRVTGMTYADQSSVQQTYDAFGNLTTLTDADGYTTHYTYDYAGRLLSEHLDAMGGSSIDSAAGLSAGIDTTYQYDVYGNLVRETKRGLETDFQYDSLGLVIAESRPHTDAVSSPPYKKYAYRLDKKPTAETTYDYVDSGGVQGLQELQQAGIHGLPSFGSAGAGGVKVSMYDALGNLLEEQSEGYFLPVGGTDTSPHIEKTVSYTYNGLGQRLTRAFWGEPAIYENQRDPDTGRFLWDAAQTTRITDYTTYWQYDLRGNLLQSYDQVDVGGIPKTFNTFSYTYTPTGMEASSNRDLRVRALYASSTGDATAMLAASVGGVTSTYNERDQLMKTVVSDEAASDEAGLESTPYQVTTTYDYYEDGSKHIVTVGTGPNASATTYTYDLRGRTVSVVDDNGTTAPAQAGLNQEAAYADYEIGSGAATATISYEGGTVHQTVSWAGGCSHDITTTFALKAFKASESVTNNCDSYGDHTRSASYQYNSDGALISMTSSEAKADPVTHAPTDLQSGQTDTYDEYGSLIQAAQTTQYHRTKYKQYGELTINNTRTSTYVSVPVTGYLREKLVANTATEYADQNNHTKYDLDAWGNRLGVQAMTFTSVDGNGQPVSEWSDPSAYDGYIKRYDATGNVAMFFKYEDSSRSAYSDFLYDPKGNQVLTATSGIYQYSTSGSLMRDYNSTYHVGHETQVIRKRWGTHNTTTWSDDSQAVWDGSFSLADGVRSATKWSAVVLFDLANSSAPLPLSAPTPSISARLGVAPSDIDAPKNAVPTVGDGVQPPDGVTPPDPSAGQPASSGMTSLSVPDQGLSALGGMAALTQVSGGATPSSSEASDGVSAFGLAPLTQLTPDGTNGGSAFTATAAGPEGNSATTGDSIDLSAPTNVLPATVTGSGTMDGVVAPQESALPPDTLPSPGDVASPTREASPELGPTPATGPGDIVPPSGAEPPSIPPIASGGPRPIDSVTPPIGWVPDPRDGSVGTLRVPAGDCPDGYFQGTCITTSPPGTLGDEADANATAIARATGGAQTTEERSHRAYELAVADAKRIYRGAIIQDAAFRGDALSAEEVQRGIDAGDYGLLNAFLDTIKAAPIELQTELVKGFTGYLKEVPLDATKAAVDDIKSHATDASYNSIGWAYEYFGVGTQASDLCRGLPYGTCNSHGDPRAGLIDFAELPTYAKVMFTSVGVVMIGYAALELAPEGLVAGGAAWWRQQSVAGVKYTPNRAAPYEEPSSRALTQALERAGYTKGPYDAAHHIVAGKAGPAARARAILEKFGIGINDAENGVFLPRYEKSPNPLGSTVHSSLHTNFYHALVAARLALARTPEDVRHVLAGLRDGLLNGTIRGR